ncbi:MAG: xanthine dehydrogenase accessory factor [Granulosicoccus sp.]|jgi:xanthine dehydrogenase accessory factor
MLKHSWQQALAKCHESAQAFTLVTVVGATGSTPREGGSKMVVTANETFDTIGGGRLEFLATQRARELLAKKEQVQQVHHFPLAAEANQCCGGSMTVLFEVFPETVMNVVIFGAGHVGSALITIVSGLDMQVTWVDSRAELFPTLTAPSVMSVLLENPVEYLEQIASGACIVIVTHDHALDYELTREILEQDDFTFLGLIGSDTKAGRFRKRLRHDGFDETIIERVRCPIGDPKLNGKLPMEVAVSIAAQLLSLPPVAERLSRRGLSWGDIKEVIQQGGAIQNEVQP